MIIKHLLKGLPNDLTILHNPLYIKHTQNKYNKLQKHTKDILVLTSTKAHGDEYSLAIA